MKNMTLVNEMPDKEVILKLLDNLFPDSQLSAMKEGKVEDLATTMKIVMDEKLATTLRNDKSHVRGMSENS